MYLTFSKVYLKVTMETTTATMPVQHLRTLPHSHTQKWTFRTRRIQGGKSGCKGGFGQEF